MPIRLPKARRDRLTIVQAPAGERPETFAEAVRRGLTHRPKYLPCQFIYDAIGSALFEQICDLPEYYLTRTEDGILREHGEAMVAGFPGPPTMIELGSGSSTKTRRLIEAALHDYGRLHYVPIDVSPTILEASARALIDDYKHLRVTGIAGDYRTALRGHVDRFEGPRLFAFLGSSIGNFDDDDALGLLREIRRPMGPDDRLLMGTDLVKDAEALEAAYDDAQGVTARFNANILGRINRELGGDFDLGRFRYRARYRPEAHRVEMHLISDGSQSVAIPEAGLVVRFDDGEGIHTENSHKYTPTLLDWLARDSGFVEETSWSDPAGAFRVQRWRPRD